MKKLIETALPLREITASSIEEKVRKGHPGNLHLWWNRSPIVSSSVLIYAAMTDEDQDSEKRNNQIALVLRFPSRILPLFGRSRRISGSS